VLMRVVEIVVGIAVLGLVTDQFRRLHEPERAWARRLALILAAVNGPTLTALVRSVVPALLFVGWMGALMVFLGVVGDREVPGTVWAVAVAGIALLALNLLVVLKFGRPRIEIPRVWRGKSEPELRTWFEQDDI